MEICKRVGANIRQLREAKDWSQEELADQAGFHRTYISGVERGIRNPTIIVLERIAKALKVNTAELLQ